MDKQIVHLALVLVKQVLQATRDVVQVDGAVPIGEHALHTVITCHDDKTVIGPIDIVGGLTREDTTCLGVNQ